MANGLTPEDVRVAAAAATAFLTPARPGSAPRSFPGSPNSLWVRGPLGKVAVLRAGEGPAVLLVHGWEGQVADFASFIFTFLEAGYQLIGLDLPAHGSSEGATVSIPDCAQTLLRIAETFGGFTGVIAHSLGAAISVHAAGMGLEAKHMVLISAPSRYEEYARRFAAQSGLNSRQTEEMIRVLEERGTGIRDVSTPETARKLRQRALFIHSMDDRVVPASDALESANAWAGARFLRVEGLGHRRILQAPVVLESALEFISG